MTNLLNKTLLATAMLAALATGACASDNNTSNAVASKTVSGDNAVHVSVKDIKSDTGYIMAALFTSADTFLGPDPLQGMRIEVKDGVAEFDFKGLTSGEYAITLFHDVDADGKMAKNAFGIPTEPYGFSNDAPIRFGPPKWEAAHFTVSAKTTTQTISLK